MAYGRLVGSLAGTALKLSPFGGAASMARSVLGGIPGLSSLLGGMSASQKRLKSRARLMKLEGKVAAGTISAKGLARLRKKAGGPYAKQAQRASMALEAYSQSKYGESPSVGAGPMKALPTSRGWVGRATGTSSRRRKVTRSRAPSRRAGTTASGRSRSRTKTRKRVKTSRMPAGLARYWRKRNERRRAA